MLVGVIVQTYLDDIAAAVMKGDFVTYRDAVSLPFHLITHSASLVVSTEQELRVGFETFNKMLISQQVTQYIRLVESAKQLDQTLISSRYTTHLMANGTRIMDPFTSQITLRLEGNTWRAASITNALANSRWPLLVPKHPETDPQKGPDQ